MNKIKKTNFVDFLHICRSLKDFKCKKRNVLKKLNTKKLIYKMERRHI